jgi:quercetin dioxygenase-like cupin family protein
LFLESVRKIKGEQVTAPGAEKVQKQVLVGPAQGWPGWVMRLFTLAPGGHTPRHVHPWLHVNYVVSGRGTIFIDGKEYSVEAGFVACIPGGTEHQFKNAGEEDFSVICIVPEEGEG